jgi:hypothetical protein
VSLPDHQQEAAEVLARSECRRHGHDFETVVNDANDLVSVYCGRCSRAWAALELLDKGQEA